MDGGRAFLGVHIDLVALGFLVLLLLALVRLDIERDRLEDLLGVVGQRQLGHFAVGRGGFGRERRPFGQDGAHVVADKVGDAHTTVAF